jgi:hypothetical protein
VDDFLDNSLDIALTLGKIQGAKLGGALPVEDMGPEYRATSLALTSNSASHFLANIIHPLWGCRVIADTSAVRQEVVCPSIRRRDPSRRLGTLL